MLGLVGVDDPFDPTPKGVASRTISRPTPRQSYFRSAGQQFGGSVGSRL